MRITGIKFTQKTNLGNYESLEFMAEAVLDEGVDNTDEATQKLADYVDWNAKKPIREAKARTYRHILLEEKATVESKSEAEIWLRLYEERKAKIESL